MTESQAASMVGNEQTPLEIASGMPCSLSVNLSNYAKRALHADEQTRKIVSGR